MIIVIYWSTIVQNIFLCKQSIQFYAYNIIFIDHLVLGYLTGVHSINVIHIPWCMYKATAGLLLWSLINRYWSYQGRQFMFENWNTCIICTCQSLVKLWFFINVNCRFCLERSTMYKKFLQILLKKKLFMFTKYYAFIITLAFL